ncbi:MAG: aminoacyl-tRNA hydrolase [Desulfovibrio sp.]|jgi:PTH1 family peptidyl-tRNA hydrolase|nr:aminoacyl-tRNA hydrolase [Desulfovibrio sp.]
MEYQGALIGLGNPGPRYAGTRHNMGFLLVSALLARAGEEGRLDELNGSRFGCELYRVHLAQLGGVWLAARPLTFMNESGRCARPLLAWHKLPPSRLVVAHDELDIPAGELRFKRSGGNAGHNGLKSVAECLGTQDFFRLRMGIGRPSCKGDALNWVLGRPDEADSGLLNAALPRALDVLFAFAGTGLEAAARLARHQGGSS